MDICSCDCLLGPSVLGSWKMGFVTFSGLRQRVLVSLRCIALAIRDKRVALVISQGHN